MKKYILSLFIVGTSIIPIAMNVDELSGILGWQIFFYIVAIVLIIIGGVLWAKKILPPYSCWVIIGLGSFLGGVTLRESLLKQESERYFAAWTDYRSGLGEVLSRWTILNPLDSYKADVRTHYTMAENYLYGLNGYPIDYILAKDNAQKAADKRNPKGHALLGIMYLKGLGCKPDSTQAFDNMLIAIKEGYEQVNDLARGLSESRITLSAKDSSILANSLSNSQFLDSAINVLGGYYQSNYTRKGKENKYFEQFGSFVQSNKTRLESLSDEGYYRAADILYFSLLTSGDKEGLRKYATVLWEYGCIPDTPYARKLFFIHLLGQEYNQSHSEEEKLNKLINNEDFVELAFADSFTRFRDKYKDFRYRFARFERAKYLVANREHLNHLYFSIDEMEHISSGYDFALSSLNEITQLLSIEMHERPLVFSSTDIK